MLLASVCVYMIVKFNGDQWLIVSYRLNCFLGCCHSTVSTNQSKIERRGAQVNTARVSFRSQSQIHSKVCARWMMNPGQSSSKTKICATMFRDCDSNPMCFEEQRAQYYRKDLPASSVNRYPTDYEGETVYALSEWLHCLQMFQDVKVPCCLSSKARRICWQVTVTILFKFFLMRYSQSWFAA